MKSSFRWQTLPWTRRSAGWDRAMMLAVLFTHLLVGGGAAAQTAILTDAWWTYQQDCNGDGCKAGTLPGDRARLNWNPDVINCNGTLAVYEIVYSKPCDLGTWIAIFTNSLHTITGCRSSDAQSVDVPLAAGCVCRDYKIEIYRSGRTVPDDIRSGANDPDLGLHREQLLADDFCLSDYFASCTSIDGSVGSRADHSAGASKEPGEPDHAGNGGGRSLWYCWTAPTSTPVTFDTLGSSFDTLLAVYVGNQVSALTLIAANDDVDGARIRQSRVAFTPVAGTTYHIAVDGFGGASGLAVLNWNQSGAALPDLILWGPAVSPTVITRTFDTNDCEVVEGCAVPGTRTLLSFTTETRNIGGGDLFLGNPATNTLFEWASCHGHYHFEEFAQYTLLDTNGNVAALGHKVGFCLLDDHVWSPSASPQARYDCNNQGIQAGWADVYAAGLPCQYIDITGVPAGDYVLKMEVNPNGLIVEADTNNNVTLVPLRIPDSHCVLGPFNDGFSNAMTVTNTPFTFSEFNICAGKDLLEPDHAGNAGGHSVWFDWTPSVNQTAVITTKRSDFDTLLAVYTGNSPLSLTPVAANDDIAPGLWQQSQVSFAASAGTTYHIAVDGFDGAVGTVVLNINPPGNDDFAGARILSGVSGTISDHTMCASKEPGEPAHAFDVGGHSIWYRWTAPTNGPVDFNTLGSAYNTTLAVYTGDSVTSLVVVSANNDDVEGRSTSRVDFEATAGTIYQIAVDGFSGAAGDLVLNWSMDCHLGINRLPDGTFAIILNGVNWQRYTLLSSTDLLTWSTNIPTTTMSGGFLQFTNSGSGLQFYRSQLSR